MKSLRVSVISFSFLLLQSFATERLCIPHASICYANILTHHPGCFCCPSAISMCFCFLLAAVWYGCSHRRIPRARGRFYCVGRAMGGHPYPVACPWSALHGSVGFPRCRLGGSLASSGNERQGGSVPKFLFGPRVPVWSNTSWPFLFWGGHSKKGVMAHNFFRAPFAPENIPRGSKKSLCACWVLTDFVHVLPFLRHTNFLPFEAHKLFFRQPARRSGTPGQLFRGRALDN